MIQMHCEVFELLSENNSIWLNWFTWKYEWLLDFALNIFFFFLSRALFDLKQNTLGTWLSLTHVCIFHMLSHSSRLSVWGTNVCLFHMYMSVWSQEGNTGSQFVGINCHKAWVLSLIWFCAGCIHNCSITIKDQPPGRLTAFTVDRRKPGL